MKRWRQTERGELALLMAAAVLVHGVLWLREVPWNTVLISLRPVPVKAVTESSVSPPRTVYQPVEKRSLDASSERKPIGSGRTRRPSYSSSTGRYVMVYPDEDSNRSGPTVFSCEQSRERRVPQRRYSPGRARSCRDF